MWSRNLIKSLGAIGIGSVAVGTTVAFDHFTDSRFTHLTSWISVQAAEKVPDGGIVTPPSPSPWAKWDYNWDKREPENLVRPKTLKATDSEDGKQALINEKKATASRNLILIRHGQYYVDGKTDSNRYLTKIGRLQAKETGNRLAELNLKFDKITYSTMARATETCNLILESFPEIEENAKADSILEEGAPYPPEPPSAHWKPEANEFLTDGARIEAAYRKYFHRADPKQKEDSTELLVCHGNVIRYFFCRSLQFPPEAWLRLSLAHCSITWLVIRPSGRVIVKSLGEIGHLPPDLITFS